VRILYFWFKLFFSNFVIIVCQKMQFLLDIEMKSQPNEGFLIFILKYKVKH
jgi:hypothetical protein